MANSTLNSILNYIKKSPYEEDQFKAWSKDFVNSLIVQFEADKLDNGELFKLLQDGLKLFSSLKNSDILTVKVFMLEEEYHLFSLKVRKFAEIANKAVKSRELSV